MRFEVTCTSINSGFSRVTYHNTLEQAKQTNHELISDPYYAVKIWDEKKKDYVLWQSC